MISGLGLGMLAKLGEGSEATRSKVRQLNEGFERFRQIPRDLADIAIAVAVLALETKDEELMLLAGEVDSYAVEDGFARFDREFNGTLVDGALVDVDQRLRTTLLRNHSHEKVEVIANRSLRVSIASRLSRIMLAEPSGYPRVSACDVVFQENFRLANDFCWQAVRELQ